MHAFRQPYIRPFPWPQGIRGDSLRTAEMDVFIYITVQSPTICLGQKAEIVFIHRSMIDFVSTTITFMSVNSSRIFSIPTDNHCEAIIRYIAYLWH